MARSREAAPANGDTVVTVGPLGERPGTVTLRPMVPFWFTLSALCFTGAAVLLYVDIGRRRGLGRRRKSWARAHGFDYEQESAGDRRPLEAWRDVHRR